MSGSFKVSQSKVKLWRRCLQAYHYKYVEELRAKRKSRALHFGTIIHKSIENSLNGEDPMAPFDPKSLDDLKLFSSELDELARTLSEARIIMKEYFIHWQDDPIRYISIDGRRAEHSFEVEILKDVLLNGKIDAIGETPKNRLRWLVEHKSFSRMPSTNARWRNLQSSVYHKVIDILGWKPTDGVVWDYIGSKAPPVPGLLQDGSVSKKKLKTLPGALRKFVIDSGFKAKDYKDYIRDAASNRSEWFIREYTPVDTEVKEFVFNQFMDTVKDMVDNHGKKSTMNIETHCDWCEFEPLCRARMQGLDFDFVKERQYEKSSKTNENTIIHRGRIGDQNSKS